MVATRNLIGARIQMARNKLAKKTVNEAEGKVSIEFTNGKTVECSLTELNEKVRNRAALHGLSQKGGDSYAGAESADEAYAAAVATFTGLKGENGEWATRGVGEGGTTILVEALFRVSEHEGRTMEECTAIVAEMSDDQKDGVKAIPGIKAAMDAISAERAAARAEKSKKDAAEKPFDYSSLFGKPA